MYLLINSLGWSVIECIYRHFPLFVIYNQCIAAFIISVLLFFKTPYCPAVHCLTGYHGYSHMTCPLFSQCMYHGSKEKILWCFDRISSVKGQQHEVVFIPQNEGKCVCGEMFLCRKVAYLWSQKMAVIFMNQYKYEIVWETKNIQFLTTLKLKLL